MTEEYDKAVGSLSEQTKKLEIANHYTYGDEEKAKQMVSGTYKDIFAIKGKFSSTTSYGAFLVFLNGPYNTVNSIYFLISPDFAIKDIKTTATWKNFEDDMARLWAEVNTDEVYANQLKDEIMGGFTVQFAKDLNKLFEMDDEIAVNRVFQKFFKERLGMQNVDMSVDYEQITSVDMEIKSSSSKKIDAAELERKKEEEERRKLESVKIDDDNPLAGREIKLILQGNVVLSPIKGKDIGKIIVGDRIKISISDKNPKAIQVAKAFNAYKEDGSFSPINGRIVSIKHQSPAGYKIYAIIAKGIYVKVDEDEDNIKIAFISETTLTQEEAEASSMKLIFLIVGVIAVLAIVGFLIIKFLL